MITSSGMEAKWISVVISVFGIEVKWPLFPSSGIEVK